MAEEGVSSICMQYLDARRKFFHNIVDRDILQEDFIAGWLNRLEKLEEEIP